MVVTYWGQNTAKLKNADGKFDKEAPLEDLCKKDSPYGVVIIGYIKNIEKEDGGRDEMILF